MALIAVAAWADEVTFDFSSEAGLQAMGITAPAQSNGVNLTDVGTITMDGVSLTAVNGSTETRVWNSQGNYALRIYVGGSITFAVESGSITDVTINAANTSNFDLLANVGNYSVNGAVGTWNGSTSSVTFSHTTTKNAQIATIVVTTSDEAPTDDPNGEGPNPVVHHRGLCAVSVGQLPVANAARRRLLCICSDGLWRRCSHLSGWSCDTGWVDWREDYLQGSCGDYRPNSFQERHWPCR